MTDESPLTQVAEPVAEKSNAWAGLTDRQKAKFLLGSLRFADIEYFLNEFKSLESPDTEEPTPLYGNTGSRASKEIKKNFH